MRSLLRFAQIREEYREHELRALCTVLEVPLPCMDDFDTATPYWPVDLSADGAVALLSRSVLIKEIAEVYAAGDSLQALVYELRAHVPLLPADVPFRILVDDHGLRTSNEERALFVSAVSFLPLTGPVALKDENALTLVFYRTPGRLWFGRRVGTAQRGLVQHLSLKRRVYLGTTSMDAELALLMANVARVRSGTVVADPFCGTGSLLLAAAQFGAHVFGADIDGRTIRGLGGTLSLRGMFRQYAMEGRLLGTLVGDVKHLPLRADMFLDAIVADPPYGVRAGAKTIGLRPGARPSARADVPSDRANRYPCTRPYSMAEIATDLFVLARARLLVGGRLVFWYVHEEADGSDFPPVLDGLILVASIPQRCRHFTRHLIVVERVAL